MVGESIVTWTEFEYINQANLASWRWGDCPYCNSQHTTNTAIRYDLVFGIVSTRECDDCHTEWEIIFK